MATESWHSYAAALARLISMEMDVKNLSQKQIADRMGIHPQSLNRLLKGKVNLTLGTISRIEEALGSPLIRIRQLPDFASSLKIETPSVSFDFHQRHFEEFRKSIRDFKRWPGANTQAWASYFLPPHESEMLPTIKLDRYNLLIAIRQNIQLNSIERKVIAILAWGGMNREYAKAAFEQKHEWLPICEAIYEGDIWNRQTAYDAFFRLRQVGKLPGMGPAYYTKLICFLNPGLQGYCMDQCCAKGINLLAKNSVVHLNKDGFVTDTNNYLAYDTFCRYIEEIAKLINRTPLDTEEALFSNGGNKPGRWRLWLKKQNSSISRVKAESHFNNKLKPTPMEPIPFHEAFGYFQMHGPTVINTLGGQSTITVSINATDHTIVITNSANNPFNVDLNHYESVLDRIAELPPDQQLMTSMYAHGNPHNWPPPNMIFTPYVPAVVMYLNEQG